MHSQALSVATCLDAVHLCIVLLPCLQFKRFLPMLDVYQEMLLNCVRLLVPVEKKTEVEGVGSVSGKVFFM